MQVNQELCVGCGECVDYCPVEAISVADVATIDQDKCVECNICARRKPCPTDALTVVADLPWPREIRTIFSDPLTPAKNTGVLGRGTEEMKTNDVTGRFKKGQVGIAIEMGRHGIGTSFLDVEKVSMAVAKNKIHFEACNPVAPLIIDESTGKFNPDVLNERALSAIIEFVCAIEDLAPVLRSIKDVSKEIDTVFSLCVVNVLDPQDTVRLGAIFEEAGMQPRPNGKTNIGLGRPRKE